MQTQNDTALPYADRFRSDMAGEGIDGRWSFYKAEALQIAGFDLERAKSTTDFTSFLRRAEALLPDGFAKTFAKDVMPAGLAFMGRHLFEDQVALDSFTTACKDVIANGGKIATRAEADAVAFVGLAASYHLRQVERETEPKSVLANFVMDAAEQRRDSLPVQQIQLETPFQDHGEGSKRAQEILIDRTASGVENDGYLLLRGETSWAVADFETGQVLAADPQCAHIDAVDVLEYRDFWNGQGEPQIAGNGLGEIEGFGTFNKDGSYVCCDNRGWLMEGRSFAELSEKHLARWSLGAAKEYVVNVYRIDERDRGAIHEAAKRCAASIAMDADKAIDIREMNRSAHLDRQARKDVAGADGCARLDDKAAAALAATSGLIASCATSAELSDALQDARASLHRGSYAERLSAHLDRVLGAIRSGEVPPPSSMDDLKTVAQVICNNGRVANADQAISIEHICNVAERVHRRDARRTTHWPEQEAYRHLGADAVECTRVAHEHVRNVELEWEAVAGRAAAEKSQKTIPAFDGVNFRRALANSPAFIEIRDEAHLTELMEKARDIPGLDSLSRNTAAGESASSSHRR